MKTILIFFTAIFLAQLSLAQNKGTYVIDVDVANVTAKKLFLYTMKRTPSKQLNWPNIDSAIINGRKATFKRDTLLEQPSWSSGIYYIDSLTSKRKDFIFNNKFKYGGKHTNFILENVAMKITGDAKEASGLTLTGSAETDMSMRYGLLAPNTSSVNKKIDEARKNGDHKALSASLSAKNDSLRAFKTLLNKLTEQHPSSWMVLLNVFQNASLLSPSELAEITNKFDKKVLSTPKGKELVNFTKQSKSLIIGADFPTFNYANKDGERLTLNNVKGKNGTLIIFWASWCGPCRSEIPDLKKIYKKYTPEGINLVSISTDHDISAWRLAMKQEMMPWVNLSNLPGDSKSINSTYNIYAIPSAFLLDAENKIVMPDEYRIPIITDAIDKLLTKK